MGGRGKEEECVSRRPEARHLRQCGEWKAVGERGSRELQSKADREESGRRQVTVSRRAGVEGHGDDKWVNLSITFETTTSSQ